MTRRRVPAGVFTVSGPGEVERRVDHSTVGLSLALTFGNRASMAGHVCSFYVRDAAGAVVHRVDVDDDGVVTVPPIERGTP